MPTDAAIEALSILRDASQFQWYVITLLLVVLYVYAVEIERKNWSAVLAALAFWGCDWFNEIWNALVFHFTNYAAVWMAPGKTAYLILIGLNIEISMMFAIMGLVAVKILPEDKEIKMFGVPNRLFMAASLSLGCVIVEIILNVAGVLIWEYPWWSAQMPVPIFFIGYLYFFLVAYWIYDMESMRKKVAITGTILGIDALLLVIFAGILGWI
jgi:hypothetical protein